MIINFNLSFFNCLEQIVMIKNFALSIIEAVEKYKSGNKDEE